MKNPYHTKQEPKEYGGFLIRILAGFLDSLILLPPLFLILFAFIRLDFSSSDSLLTDLEIHQDTLNFIILIITITYLAYFTSSKFKATLGKKLLRLYVGNIDGSKISNKKSLARALISMVNSMTLGIGFLPVLFTKEKISLHDFVCKTRVFYKNN